MKDNITKKRTTTNIIFTLLGILLFVFSIVLATYDYILEQKAINISATIISIDYIDNKSIANVRYKVEGSTYEQTITLPKNTSLTIKDQTKIKYDINNPKKIINNNHGIIIIISFLLSAILFITNLPKFLKYYNNQKRINKLYKTGQYLNANITEIFVNNNGKKIKKTLPYRLRCKYLNPSNNTEYIFESEDTYANPNEIVTQYNNKTIVVILDKHDSKNYYVDLESLIPQINIIDPLAFMSQQGENNSK